MSRLTMINRVVLVAVIVAAAITLIAWFGFGRWDIAYPALWVGIALAAATIVISVVARRT